MHFGITNLSFKIIVENPLISDHSNLNFSENFNLLIVVIVVLAFICVTTSATATIFFIKCKKIEFQKKKKVYLIHD